MITDNDGLNECDPRTFGRWIAEESGIFIYTTSKHLESIGKMKN